MRSWSTIVIVFMLLTTAAAPARAGASGWSYFVAHDADVGRALEKLKWDVLRKGKYYKLFPKRRPKSPHDALIMNDTEGTHSIMDIEKVSLVETPRGRCAIMTVCPLPKADLAAIFGTDKPTRAMVEAANEKLDAMSLQPTWSGVWIAVYDGAQPKFLYFVGHSGD